MKKRTNQGWDDFETMMETAQRKHDEALHRQAVVMSGAAT
jgi:hypothetical protein